MKSGMAHFKLCLLLHLLHLQKTANASEPDSVELSIKPFDDLEIYLANEAYG